MAVKRYNGTSWDTVAGLGAQGANAISSSITTWVKTAAGGETSLTGSSDSSTTLAYTPGQEQFFINGVLQVRGSDYTATNGTSITGLTALTAGDIATVTTVNAFSVTGAVPLSTVTANGDLIVGTSSGAVGRLGIGSTDQVLKVSGGVPVWATPAGSSLTIAQIASGTLTSGQELSLTGLSSYDTLELRVNAINISAEDLMGVRINSNSGSNYEYNSARNRATAAFDTSEPSIGFSLTAGYFDVMDAYLANANTTNHFRIKFTNCKSTGFTLVEGLYTYRWLQSGTARSAVTQWMGIYKVAEAVSSIQFFTGGSGNFSAGNYVLWGA